MDYSQTNNYDEIRLIIGNDYYSVINFAGKPENLVVSNLDLYEGQEFSVCLENEHDYKVNCQDTKLYDQDKAVYVDIESSLTCQMIMVLGYLMRLELMRFMTAESQSQGNCPKLDIQNNPQKQLTLEELDTRLQKVEKVLFADK